MVKANALASLVGEAWPRSFTPINTVSEFISAEFLGKLVTEHLQLLRVSRLSVLRWKRKVLLFPKKR